MVSRKNGEDAQRMEVNSSKKQWWKEETGVHYRPDGASSSLSPTCCAHRFVHASVAAVLSWVQHSLKQKQRGKYCEAPSSQPSLNLSTISLSVCLSVCQPVCLSVQPSIHSYIDSSIYIYPSIWSFPNCQSTYPFTNLSLHPSIHPPFHSWMVSYHVVLDNAEGEGLIWSTAASHRGKMDTV